MLPEAENLESSEPDFVTDWSGFVGNFLQQAFVNAHVYGTSELVDYGF